jgi:hypothetical protein
MGNYPWLQRSAPIARLDSGGISGERHAGYNYLFDGHVPVLCAREDVVAAQGYELGRKTHRPGS